MIQILAVYVLFWNIEIFWKCHIKESYDLIGGQLMRLWRQKIRILRKILSDIESTVVPRRRRMQ